MSQYLYSLLAFSADLKERKQQIKQFKTHGFRRCHFDVMDQIYVANKAFTPADLQLLNQNQIAVHVHLMVIDPVNYIQLYLHENIQALSFHFEMQDVQTNLVCIQTLKKHQIKAGIALHPYVKISDYLYLLKEVDYVTLMSVVPGKGGQAFLAQTDDRLVELINLREQHALNFEIEIDGGITLDIIDKYKNQIDYYVSGSFLVKKIDQLAEVQKTFKTLVRPK
ncbi:ribulose-phosphate 3-epimerase [Ureaplasma miroungigenitalium]|uniref:Ribulose-phosphate 3-epimerase n=1 Tax=Ureaplasma miroungigenitalium TaxID=1042321 RepID=A0ABT3BMW5_9BACT|nr:ribulose-phosphate 3-epimerase [Ureaplasma miroungigenitalium]MCV3728567.1 ribulose-phosphate 3-epimerase [Ureaplasma miroungigenitalium]MCV3734426.1 ribulose-phosphate 3-epimerase [Ureaplasma miroungigenitalium]